MNFFRAAIVACCAMLTTNAFGQGAADRAAARTDMTRATTEGRLQRLDQNRQTETEEVIVREEVVRKPAAKPASTASRSGLQVQKLTADRAPASSEKVRPETRTVIVRRAVTVKRAAPLKINPY